MALDIVEKDLSGVAVLELSGRVTLGEESSQLRSKLNDVLARGRTRMVLDLANVRHIDSSGLGALVAGYTSAQGRGVIMKLANLTKKLRDQLNITKLVTIFEVYDTIEDALKSFGPASQDSHS
jgi:anti-sigma B factor antagonist